MKNLLKGVTLGLMMSALPLAVHAEPMKKSSSSTSSIEKIQSMLEYHQRMVTMTQSYLKDRTQIPADYQAVSDTEFLRKAKLEKPVMEKKSMSSGSSKPAKTTSTVPSKK